MIVLLPPQQRELLSRVAAARGMSSAAYLTATACPWGDEYEVARVIRARIAAVAPPTIRQCDHTALLALATALGWPKPNARRMWAVIADNFATRSVRTGTGSHTFEAVISQEPVKTNDIR